MTPRATYLRSLHAAVLSLEPGARLADILARAEAFEEEALKRVGEIPRVGPEVVQADPDSADRPNDILDISTPDPSGEPLPGNPAAAEPPARPSAIPRRRTAFEHHKDCVLAEVRRLQGTGKRVTGEAVIDNLGLDPSTVSKAMNLLVSEGLMTRAGHGPGTVWRVMTEGEAALRPAPDESAAPSGAELKEKVLGAAAAMQARGERVTGKAVAKALKVSPSKVSASMCALVDEGRMTKDGGGPYIVWRVADGAGPSPVRDIGDPPPSDDDRLYQRIHKTALEYQRAGKPVTAVKLADILGVGLDAIAAETRVLISHGVVTADDWADPEAPITVIRGLDGSRVPSPGVRSPEWVRAGAEG